MSLPPLHKHVVVRATPATAYQVFTAGIATWWPLKSQSVFGDEAVTCVFEARAGGRVYELARDGAEALWGTVLVSAPGRRLSFTWHPGRAPGSAQEVSVRFLATEGGTRVELEHQGWAALGEKAAETRHGYDTGWDDVFVARFGGAANKPR